MTQEPAAPSSPPQEPAPSRRLIRRLDDRMLGGVASGLADYLDADVSLVRIAWVALAFLTGGLFALVYVGAWMVMPEGAGGATATSGSRRRESGASGGVVWGAILVLIGLIALVAQFDLPDPPWRAIAAGALVLVGLGIVATSRRGIHGGLLLVAIVLTVGLATDTRVPLTGIHSGFGDRHVTLSAPGQLLSTYGHAFGAMRIDLTEAALADGTTTIETNVAFGDLRITVPPNVGVRIEAATAFGSTRVLDDELGTFERGRVVTTPGYEQATKRLDIRSHTAFGTTRVSRGTP